MLTSSSYKSDLNTAWMPNEVHKMTVS